MKKLFAYLDRGAFGRLQTWEFSFRSLPREYAWLFFLKAVLAHPIKAILGLSRYRQFIREKKGRAYELPCDYARFISIPEERTFLQQMRGRKSWPLIGLGFCLKPYDINDPTRSCPSGRPNHDCLYLERGETRPVCGSCAIQEIGRLALEKGCPVCTMTSAKDIARDLMLPQISRNSFPSAILILCPYSIQAIILPQLICGVRMILLPYASGSCADYEQWLRADRGIKNERTELGSNADQKIGEILTQFGDRHPPFQRFRRQGNIFFPELFLVFYPHMLRKSLVKPLAVTWMVRLSAP
jgi:hypothetical protein